MGTWLFALGIVVAIVLHEWGHYATARRFGMRAERFFFGFGPTLWSTRRGETEYGVKALPLGGFVRIAGMGTNDSRQAPVVSVVFDPDAVAKDRAGEDGVVLADAPPVPERTWQRLAAELEQRGVPADLRARVIETTRTMAAAEPAAFEVARAFERAAEATLPDTGRAGDLRHRVLLGDEGRFFNDRPAWQRAVVLASGSGMHFVQAVVLLFVGYWAFGSVAPLPVVEEVLPSSPAAVAGLEPGDRFVAVDGEPVTGFEQLRALIQARPDRPTVFLIERQGAVVEVTITPERRDTADGPVGVLGFLPAQETRPLPLADAAYEATAGPAGVGAMFAATFEAFGRIFGPSGLANLFATLAGDVDRDPAGGISIIGAGQLAGEATATYGWISLFALLAGINVFVGVFNLVPLPPLDGGHLAILAVERSVNAVRQRSGRAPDYRVDPRTIIAIAVPVLVLIASIFVLFLILDLRSPIVLP